MIFNLTRIYIILLFLNLTMTSIGVSLLMFTLTTYISNTQHQREIDNRESVNIIHQTFMKLDQIHSQLKQQIDSQGNISSTQRQQLLNDFTNVEKFGGFATKYDIATDKILLYDIEHNITTLASKIR
jgi:hypothetical protein